MSLVFLLVLLVCIALFFFGRESTPRIFHTLDFSFARLQHILIAWFGLGFLLVIFFAVKAIPKTSDVTHPESAVVYSAQLAAQTGKLYSDLNAPPYTPTPYGPFFYSSLQLVAKVTGAEADRIRHGYRIFDFLCFLSLPLVVFSTLRRMTVSATQAMLGALAAGSAFFFHTWNVTARPDVPALLLSLLAIWIMCRREAPSVTDLVLAAVACASAILCKPSFLAAPISIFLALVVRRRWKDVFMFSGAAGLFGLGALGYYILKSEPIIRQILLVGKSPIDWRTSLYLINVYLPTGLGVVVLMLGCAGFWHAMSAGDSRLKLLGFYFMFSTVIGLVTILQVGGNCNYFFELWVAAALLSPFALFRLEDSWNAANAGIKVAALVMLLGLLLEQTYAIRQVAKLVKNYDPAPLAGLKIYSTLPYLTLHGRDPEFLDPFLLTVAEQRGVWSPALLLAKIGDEEFDVVVLMEESHQLYRYRGYDIYSPTVVSALKANYAPLCRTDSLVFLRPKTRAVKFTVADSSRVLGETCYAVGDLSF
jgi:hypothetical protein